VEEDSSLIYEISKGISAVLSAKDIIKGAISAEVAIIVGRMKEALYEDMIASKVARR
jgi:hypothetical protein